MTTRSRTHNMADIKFYYFNARGRGELCRLALVAAGKKFEDIEIDYRSEWPAKKNEAPFGQVPYMEYNGKKYAQALAIATYFAREAGLYGKTNLDGLRIDEVTNLVQDLRVPRLREWFLEQDPAKKAEKAQNLKDEVIPKYMGFFESLLKDNGGNGYFVGNSVSLADLAVYDNLDTVLGIDPEAIATCPSLQKLRSNVEAVPAIKSYFDSRPKRTF